MEYLFGTLLVGNKMRQTVRIKTSKNETIPNYNHGEFCTNVERYNDTTVTHRYKVENKFYEYKDKKENNYVWYFISEYSKNVDGTDYAIAQSKQYNYETNSKIDYIAMMTDVDIPDFNNIGG